MIIKLEKCHSLDKIADFCIQLVQNRVNADFVKECNRVLREYLKFIRGAQLLPSGSNYYQVSIDVTSSVSRINTEIRKCIKYYLQGEISTCYKTFEECWRLFNDKMVVPHSLDYKMDLSSIWYRMRKEKDINIPLEGMFHVPYSLRGKISNYRYSVTGYPCLYLGKSIYTCWEEIRRPEYSNFIVSAFKPIAEITVLDMRLCRNHPIQNKYGVSYYLKFIPFILASSIKVMDDDDVFKPEYIIPQLILHSIINSNGSGYDGIIYTSTRIDERICGEPALFDNLVLPVRNVKSNMDYCTHLANMFEMTKPMSYEILQILDNRRFHKSNNNWVSKYNNSIFGIIENYLRNDIFYKLN